MNAIATNNGIDARIIFFLFFFLILAAIKIINARNSITVKTRRPSTWFFVNPVMMGVKKKSVVML
jgi:hypothetical protein